MFRNRVSKRNLLLISIGLLILTAMSIILAPKKARAEEGIPIRGTFTVAYSGTPNTAGVSFCGGRPLDIAVEAHGAGSSTLGALSFSLEKTLEATGPLMHGCLTLTTPSGDKLAAIYDGTEGSPNANNFGFGDVALTFTWGNRAVPWGDRTYEIYSGLQ